MELIIPCFKFQQFENALESINRAFSKHDGKYKPSMLNLRGRIYSALGEYENAIDDYRESYELVQDRGRLLQQYINSFKDN